MPRETRTVELPSFGPIGAGYEVPIHGRVTGTPELNTDFAEEGTTPVDGVSFGSGF